MDARDAAIETLAASEAALLERVGSLEADVQAYRELAQQAIHALHDLKGELAVVRRRYHQLLDGRRKQPSSHSHQGSVAA